MSLLRKSLPGMLIAMIGALTTTAAGTAHADRPLYAAIAVGHDRVGEATDYPDQISADQAALRACEKGVVLSCRVEARVHNACGAVVERDVRKVFGSAPDYFVGIGVTRADAERDARLYAGRDRSTALIQVTKPAFVLDTICTSNAR
jgi:hypothetical protein